MNSEVKKQFKFYFSYWKYVIAIFIVMWVLAIILQTRAEALIIQYGFSAGMFINILLINQLKIFPFTIKLGCSRSNYFKASNLFNGICVGILIILINIAAFAGVERLKEFSLYSLYFEFKMFLMIFAIVLFLNLLITLLFRMGNVYWVALVLVIISIPITFRYKIYNYTEWTTHDGIQGYLETVLSMVLISGLLFLNWIFIKKSEISN